MATVIAVRPPFEVPFFQDPKRGIISPQWKSFLLGLQTQTVAGAPADGTYVVYENDSRITNAVNFGALVSGYLKLSVALGIATPITTPTIPSADLTGALPALSGAALTNLNASELTAGTVPDARFPATLPALSGVNLTDLTGANLDLDVVGKTFGDTGYVATPNQTVLVTATGGATTIKLPTPSVKKWVTVKKVDASVNAVTISGNGHTIDGAATQTLALQWNSKTMVGDGSNWFVVAVV